MSERARDDRRTTAQNVAFALALRTARYPVLLLYLLVVPRLLGPSDYGQFAFLVAALTIVSELLTFGALPMLGRYGLAYTGQGSPSRLSRLVSTLLTLRLATTLLVGLAAGAVWAWLGEPTAAAPVWGILYATVLVDQVEHLIFSYLYGLNFMGRYFARYLLRSALRLVFVASLYPSFGMPGAVLGLLASSMGTLLFGLCFLRGAGRLELVRAEVRHFWPEIRFGLAMIAPTLLLFLQQQFGPILLKALGVASARIGYFDLANQGFLLLLGITATGLESLVPMASRYERSGRGAESRRWMLLFLRYALAVTVVAIASFYVAGRALIDLLLGEAYAEVYGIALWMLGASVAWVVGFAGYVLAVAGGLARVYLVAMAASTGLFFPGAVLGIWVAEAVGLAWSTAAAGVAFSGVMLWFFPVLGRQVGGLMARLAVASLAWSPLLLAGPGLGRASVAAYGAGLLLFVAALRGVGLIRLDEFGTLLRVMRERSPAQEPGVG